MHRKVDTFKINLNTLFSRQHQYMQRTKFPFLIYTIVWLLSCLTICDPMDCSAPGSSAHGISQARILGCVAISFSSRSSQPRDWTCLSFTGRRILHHWSTRVAQFTLLTLLKSPSHVVLRMENDRQQPSHLSPKTSSPWHLSVLKVVSTVTVIT